MAFAASVERRSPAAAARARPWDFPQLLRRSAQGAIAGCTPAAAHGRDGGGLSLPLSEAVLPRSRSDKAAGTHLGRGLPSEEARPEGECAEDGGMSSRARSPRTCADHM